MSARQAKIMFMKKFFLQKYIKNLSKIQKGAAHLRKCSVHYVVTELKSRSEETTNTKEMCSAMLLAVIKQHFN